MARRGSPIKDAERRPDLRVIEGARYPHLTGALSSWLR